MLQLTLTLPLSLPLSHRFSMESYDLLHNNCNNFTNECSIFLTGTPIPEYITSLPSQVLNTPLGPMIEQMMRGMHQQGGPMPSIMPGGMPMSNLMSSGPPMAASAPAAATPAGGVGGGSEWGFGGNGSGGGAHGEGVVGIAAPARSQRRHAHEELDATLPTLISFSKPLLLQDTGDKGAASMARLRALLQAHHEDKSNPAVPAEEIEALGAIEELLKTPVADAPAHTHTLPKPCYRFLARVLAKWPVSSWAPALDLMRLLLLYPGVALHYAGTASSHCTIIVKRCLAKTAVSDEIPKGVKLRALFLVINMFAHACGVEKLMRPGAAADIIDAALDLINSADATIRMSAAAVLFNVSLYLPKVEGLEMVQISSGVAYRLESEVDDETGTRPLALFFSLLLRVWP